MSYVQALATGQLDGVIAARWSPNGEQIVFAQHVSGKKELFLMDAKGEVVRRLTVNDYWDWMPTWSSDGRSILFAACPTRDDRVAQAEEFRLFRMDLITGETLPIGEEDGVDQCDWSSDGSRIVYASNMRGFVNTDLVIISADGTGARRLIESENDDEYPRWSPDGQQVLFTRNLWKVPQGYGEVWVIHVDGSGARKLTDGCYAEWVVK